uniref:Uncharacterized protein n=1 Tax=Chromera velia CCMP2878 TaxID=1169474 RepID=A0A0G4I0Z5_9ALVE|eukprot:Cvel_1644.t1-p1 / transcript=Cvel_1644.t1 / gene=Cvel_1644 / organism=Chromera_velia_CCMP2878 / gene_product=hypothetical protein / transcript_product=hypothetical protein / location=Cvel_scaffold59:64574-65370(+) / protein_length=109 / sequence_SO=supercontig / SO=protein_coding / is_pseudo=false
MKVNALFFAFFVAVVSGRLNVPDLSGKISGDTFSVSNNADEAITCTTASGKVTSCTQNCGGPSANYPILSCTCGSGSDTFIWGCDARTDRGRNCDSCCAVGRALHKEQA